jgi:lysophospholipase L1-like esterase
MSTNQILIYADSLSWGIIPNTRGRLPFEQRWPGVFEKSLNHSNQSGSSQTDSYEKVRVIENCLNGRRTVWSDPDKAGRNGSKGLAEVIEMHSPLNLVILMLGTNDFQSSHYNNALMSAQGTAKLIQIIRSASIEPGMPIPKIMIVSPPPIIEPKANMTEKFAGAKNRCIGLAAELEKVAKEHSVLFFDAASVTEASLVDGVHLDLNQHQILGEAIAKVVVSTS